MIFVILRKLLLFSVSVALIFLVIETTPLKNGETLPSYVSFRTLDRYGNAIQLGHAKESARRYGRSVVVAVIEISEQKNITEITPKRDHRQHKSKGRTDKLSSLSFLMVVSMGKSPILQPIQLPLVDEEGSDDSSSLLAMCFTGVKGDANWLLQQIQKYSADIWERFLTSTMSASVAAHAVARLLVRFAAQSEKHEWQSSLRIPGKQDRDDYRQSSWSRPLGVQTMILSLSSRQSSSSAFCQQRLQEPRLLVVEPSGRITNPEARSKSKQVSLGAMGKGSDKIHARLLRLLRGKSDVETSDGGFSSSSPNNYDGLSSSSWEEHPPTHDKCRDALIQILLEETTNIKKDNDSSHPDTGFYNIMVESYSPHVGQIERRLFRYQNVNTPAEI